MHRRGSDRRAQRASRGHKTRKASRKLRYRKRRSLRLKHRKGRNAYRKTMRGGMVESVVSKDGTILEAYNDPPVRVGGTMVVPYSVFLRDFKGKTEQELD